MNLALSVAVQAQECPAESRAVETGRPSTAPFLCSAQGGGKYPNYVKRPLVQNMLCFNNCPYFGINGLGEKLSEHWDRKVKTRKVENDASGDNEKGHSET